MTTGERMAKIEEKIDNHCEQNKKDFDRLEKMIYQIEAKLDIALNKKAGKWVEKWLYLVVAAIVSAAIGFFIWLVQKGIL